MGMINVLKLEGKTFGRLTVVERATGRSRWLCKCECGSEHIVRSDHLNGGKVDSCGCAKSERVTALKTTHGQRHRCGYQSWTHMIDRCTNPDNDRWKDYGGRGITVCDRWLHDAAAFFSDMGDRPTPKHSIDRIDVNGNYEPGNCKWSTNAEQQKNKRNTKRD